MTFFNFVKATSPSLIELLLCLKRKKEKLKVFEILKVNICAVIQ